jgi:CRISPR-associated protein Cas6
MYRARRVAKLGGVRSRFWSDDPEDAAGTACAAADLAFALCGRAIPCDYAFALSHAVVGLLPWLPRVQGAGLRLALGAESGNGWQRDEGNGALLYLPRRARLILRLPPEALQDARALADRTLEVAGLPLRVGEPSVLALSPSHTLYARHVIDESGDEEVFLGRVAEAIDAPGTRRQGIMCGKSRRLATAGGELCTRSVLVAGLAPRDSLALLAGGIGSGRLLGCGLFVPYRRPDALARSAED